MYRKRYNLKELSEAFKEGLLTGLDLDV